MDKSILSSRLSEVATECKETSFKCFGVLDSGDLRNGQPFSVRSAAKFRIYTRYADMLAFRRALGL
jgi:hypothetical protein